LPLEPVVLHVDGAVVEHVTATELIVAGTVSARVAVPVAAPVFVTLIV
jgi:hypothetical protein